MKITQFILDKTQNKLCIEFSTNNNIVEKELSFEYLRISSPEASAKKQKNGQVAIITHKKNVVLISIESVAKHGYRLGFDDGHSAIYDEDYLQTIALEYDLRWQDYLADIKASGHSREAMIEFKQL